MYPLELLNKRQASLISLRRSRGYRSIRALIANSKCKKEVDMLKSRPKEDKFDTVEKLPQNFHHKRKPNSFSSPINFTSAILFASMYSKFDELVDELGDISLSNEEIEFLRDLLKMKSKFAESYSSSVLFSQKSLGRFIPHLDRPSIRMFHSSSLSPVISLGILPLAQHECSYPLCLPDAIPVKPDVLGLLGLEDLFESIIVEDQEDSWDQFDD
ncbi:hypothetical protein ADUPG1_007063 [Aduncisulcus paluster]|uniref:Uncharacterized protein n=1 Tax=Aduncisulcus paluster TaxID=2918883 RepID=A0ABQ5KNK4_9EUKA|nr:hypothetical protein ADUPG1_007063 [Aduncisulcus paluster]|eukprot:gnl/Carplike_NY0171/4560_a6200_348.p1 GENE.gnl/Carplike_NY0171/4560_a6200_348~~gnl/Carplike_NY0171/4560_a6200_348.p1  ORF type:complete len:214 (-),score=26.72 gnl/Carplike_NY0171/4560_a6200_348:193-834(-)